MSEICKLIFKKDGIYAEYWIPPIFKEKTKKENKKDELVLVDNDYFDKLEKKIKEEILIDGYYTEKLLEIKEETNIFSHLRRTCVIDVDVTLRDIMSYVRSNKNLTNFIKKYSWAEYIDDYHKILDKEESNKNENITELEISWTADEIVEYEDPKKANNGVKVPCFILNHGLSGLGPAKEWAKDYGVGEEDMINWSVSGQIDDILDIPIKLSKEFIRYNKVFFPKEKGIKITTLLEGEGYFTLLDILDAIYFDISFYGSPSDSKKFFEEINRRVEISKDLLKGEKINE